MDHCGSLRILVISGGSGGSGGWWYRIILDLQNMEDIGHIGYITCGSWRISAGSAGSKWKTSALIRSAHPKFLQQPPLSHHSYIAWLLTVIGNFRNSFDLFVNVESNAARKPSQKGFGQHCVSTLKGLSTSPFIAAQHCACVYIFNHRAMLLSIALGSTLRATLRAMLKM